MHHDALRAYCLAKPAAEEGLPFGPGALVYKVMGKMFALLPEGVRAGEELYIVVKVDPNFGQLLRESYRGVNEAWHFNKRHWISVAMDADVPDDEVCSLIDHSYALVVKGLTRAKRAELERGLEA